ncbi:MULTISPECIES: aspartate--tRNA ligase [unclassified Lactobacillus]|uniref:aspartate--tRNA ligase n=1 Tax=unclassified Lactobacillus TaxID=2620435 RepID=UPI000EFC53D6|nr:MULTISPECIES: aspartate--tRNA ligase [unclassified Lactobacillus]RMC40004.1 aspartate--tRNA ligase [Lactobacillus sp. ESL0237]RMC44165.1 aspartate--tRNA ligase [Lactobacillus sp. ESL0234]RMC45493.1 aspartate--tRNA ligase [Lactobacillus sp. ESL0236]RMC50756.1 aspartate--tRNA ligase [Lactobacillus sp. ESL0225]
MEKRTNYCGNITAKYIGQKVNLYGWVQRVRNLGNLVFIDLRDREGLVQVVINHDSGQELMHLADQLGNEYVIQVKGEVVKRSSINPEMKTGEVEINAQELIILNKSQNPPFEIKDNIEVGEQTRLKYRYLDLRRPSLQKALILRSKILQATHEYFDENGFINIETPILGKSSPEGARDYLVPSRIYPGSFYALPQSPQLFKQLLMGAGFDKYYQLSRCFRDEDLRGDRQPEFTQIDMETSFTDEEQVQEYTEGLLKKVMKDVMGIDLKTPIDRITWTEAMNNYGTDKPDLRFGMQIHDLSPIFKNSDFKVFSNAISAGGFVKGIAVKNGAETYSRKQIEKKQDFIKRFHAKGLAWVKFENGEFNGPIARFLNEENQAALIKEFSLTGSELLVFIADKWKVCCDSLDHLRREFAKETNIIPKHVFNFVWVVDWPLFEYDEGIGRWIAAHHPFTMPDDEGIKLLDTDPHKAHARSYDIVMNGDELGGGSIRIHKRSIQEKMLKALGFSKKRSYEQFGYLLDALDMGFPPHAGLAIGLDRFAMLLAEKDNIRDVLAFPKNANASEPMMHAPAPVAEQQLADLGIEVEAQYHESVAKIETTLKQQAEETAAKNTSWDEN